VNSKGSSLNNNPIALYPTALRMATPMTVACRPRWNCQSAITPRSLCVFPSWLEHSMSAVHGPGERISIAFNAKLAMT